MLLLCSFLLTSPAVWVRAQEGPAQAATVVVALFEEDDSPASQGQLFVFNLDQQSFQNYEVTAPAMQLRLLPGRYRIYSAQSKPMGDHVARYSSPEAKLVLGKSAYESIILRYQKGEDPMTLLSHSTLSKVGLPDSIGASSN